TIAKAPTQLKDNALLGIAEAVEGSRAAIRRVNQEDLERGRQKGLDAALLDRLKLTDKRFSAMLDGLRQVAALPDPIGQISDLHYLPSGIQVGKMRVPLGTIGIIYESRPNVTIEAASLCIKSGNAAILRGGSEAIHANMELMKCVHAGLMGAGLPAEVVQLVGTADRDAVHELITMSAFVDVIIPRGGKGLIERILEHAKVPV